MARHEAHRSMLARIVVRIAGPVAPAVRRTLVGHPAILRWMQMRLALATPSGMTEVVVAGGALRGMRLRLDLLTEKYYWLGDYEPALERIVADHVSPGMVVYDVGANIGYTALLFALAVREAGSVYAFEPLPGNADRIREHAEANGRKSIEVVVAALADSEGEATFLLHESHGMGKLAGVEGWGARHAGTTRVRTLRMDDFVYRDGHPPPDVVKLDIEGGGVLAVLGMERTLREARPLVLAELHGRAEGLAVCNALLRNGYALRGGPPDYAPVAVDALDFDSAGTGVVAFPPASGRRADGPQA